MSFSDFQIAYDTWSLSCDWCGPAADDPIVVLHGAGNSSRERFAPLRKRLLEVGISSVALDFLGHGRSSGTTDLSSLSSRTRQAACLIDHCTLRAPLFVLGSSMGAYNAIKLTETRRIGTLVLSVPAAYTQRSYEVSFGPSFSEIIRGHQSWAESDAFATLSKFTGNVLIIAAERDEVIPSEVPERLYASATASRKRELLWIKDSSHLLSQFLANNNEVMGHVVQKIRAFVF